MPYRKIPIVAGQYYHVFNRVAEGRLLFYSDANYRYFLRRMAKILPLHPLEIICYCLMPNHFHFLIKTILNNTVSGFISLLLNGYVKSLNVQTGMKGPMFPARFKHVPVVSDVQLMYLMRYIHLNPVKAGLVGHPTDWPYSNYRGFVNSQKDPGVVANITPGSFNSLNPGIFSTWQATRDLYFKSPEEYALFVKDMTVENPKGFEKYCLE